MLHGANLDIKFWPYAFPSLSTDQDQGPNECPLKLATGKVDDFSRFRTFGCREFGFALLVAAK